MVMRKLFLTLLILIFCLAGVLIALIESSQISPSASLVAIPSGNSGYIKTTSDLRDSFILQGKSFLEVNLSAMRIKLFLKGKAKKEWPILVKGDPQGWGGSALGLYNIMSGNTVSFSVVSEVYMPYALHYYGKYYIHGEPYYPDGNKRVTIFTGGCIQLYDKYAKEIYEMAELNMPVLVIDKERGDYQYSSKELFALPEISAESYLAADLDSGFVFAEKNSEEKLPLTYLTQLMTALLVSENIDLRKSVLVRSEMLKASGSTQGLQAGKSFRVVELFYPLLIESSNNAAEVLSHFLGREKTVRMMNEKAEAILMDKTEFVDPTGSDLKNVSTGQDLFQLSRYLLNARPPLLEITRGKEVKSFGEISFDVNGLWNKNIFINDPDFIGGKTGVLSESRNNGLFMFKFPVNDKESRNIVIILLDTEDNKSDAQKIYAWLLGNYSSVVKAQELLCRF